MKNNVYMYIFLSALITYLLRAIPTLLIKDEIKNKFVRSFLYYVPYVTLSVMTFPTIVNQSEPQIAGLIALIVGSIMAWKNQSLIRVAIACSVIVFAVESIFRMMM